MKLHSDTYDNYKKSEGEWVDAIPDEWQEKRVKDLFRMVTQTAPANNGYELLSLYASIGVRPRKDMEARGNKASSTDGYWMVKKNDIVVNKLLAWMGSVGLSEYDGVTSPAYDVLRQVKPEIDPRYFAYLFRTETAKKIFRKNSRGIMDMRLRLYFDKLGTITVPVPSYSTQQVIASYVDKKVFQIDKKIELLNRKADLYSKLRQSIIDYAVKFGLDRTVPMEDSDIKFIGKMPLYWKEARLEDVSNIIDPQPDHRAPAFAKGEGYPYIGIRDLNKDGTLNFETARKVELSAIEKQERAFKVVSGDILFCKVGTLGEPRIIITKDRFALSATLVLIKVKNNISNRFLKYVLESAFINYQIGLFGSGSTRPALGIKQIRKFLFSFPPLDEQLKIADCLDKKTVRIDGAISNISIQIMKLKELRIAMINDAVTGKIKVVDDVNKGQAA